MYKVFINEKRLTLSKDRIDAAKHIQFDGTHSLEMAIDQLQNTSTTDINLYGAHTDVIWDDFKSLFRIVEAAGGIVRNSENKILFIYRLSKWDLPKGKIEKGESLEDAAVREVAEETLLTNIKLQDFITTTYHVYTERNGDRVSKMTHWFKMDFFGTENPVPQVEEGITDVQWLDENQIRNQVFPNTFKNIQLILNDQGIK